MKKMPLNRKDLNLLTVLEALYREKSVSRAAQQLNLTQSAVSHALQRLRDNFGDEMFVRSKGGIAPTVFVQGIMPEINEILGASKRLFEIRNAFEPGTSDRLFRLGMPEYTGFVLLPALQAILQKEAPHIKILTLDLMRSEWEEILQDDRADLIVGRFNVPTKGYDYDDLFDDDFVCLGGARTPHLKGGKISLEHYLNARHINISMTGTQHNRVDRILADMGHERTFSITVSNYGSALHLLQDSDMLLTVHTRIADAVAKRMGLKVAKLPFKSPSYETRQIWHRRYNDDLGHQWLRKAIQRAAKA